MRRISQLPHPSLWWNHSWFFSGSSERLSLMPGLYVCMCVWRTSVSTYWSTTDGLNHSVNRFFIVKVEVSEQQYLCVWKISRMININSARTNKCNEGSTDKHRVHSGPFPGSAAPPEMSDPKLTRFLSVSSGPHRLSLWDRHCWSTMGSTSLSSKVAPT